jgi:hypothetical protein
VIHPNGHSDNGNAGVIQEPAGEETLSNVPFAPDATAPFPRSPRRVLCLWQPVTAPALGGLKVAYAVDSTLWPQFSSPDNTDPLYVVKEMLCKKGRLTRSTRSHGPDVWEFRWREAGPDGRRKHRRMVIKGLTRADDLEVVGNPR